MFSFFARPARALNAPTFRQAARLVVLCAILTTLLVGQTYTVIHKFSDGADGSTPQAGLTMDGAGNFYGTATFGGSQISDVCQLEGGCGVVFKLSRHGSAWTLQNLYSFLGGADGNGPLSRVVFGPDGALYGTTQTGGGNGCAQGQGCGTVFRLRPPSGICKRVSCPWTETVLHGFTSGTDGEQPYFADLVFDVSGSMYGTTPFGGVHNQGTLFKLIPHAGNWTESVIYAFGGGAAVYPTFNVVFDSQGNLYGTANGGQPYFEGVVYRLQPAGSSFTESTLFTFTGDDNGASPGSGLISDGAGNFYGTTTSRGPGTNGGTVYELTGSGTDWALTTITGIDGGSGGPKANLTMDRAGNLYGTTNSDGANGYGSVFKVTPQASGTWQLTTLYSFTGFDDGRWPSSSVAIDSDGNLWGTTANGGDRTKCNHVGCGVIWEISFP